MHRLVGQPADTHLECSHQRRQSSVHPLPQLVCHVTCGLRRGVGDKVDVVDRGRERHVKLVGPQKRGLHLITELLPVTLQFALLSELPFPFISGAWTFHSRNWHRWLLPSPSFSTPSLLRSRVYHFPQTKRAGSEEGATADAEIPLGQGHTLIRGVETTLCPPEEISYQKPLRQNIPGP